jgi:hypothetical protein
MIYYRIGNVTNLWEFSSSCPDFHLDVRDYWADPARVGRVLRQTNQWQKKDKGTGLSTSRDKVGFFSSFSSLAVFLIGRKAKTLTDCDCVSSRET